jgi:hypothetical protein
MGKDIITVPSTLESINRKKDRSVSLRFSSLFEMSNEDFSRVDAMFQTSGYLLFSDEKLGTDDIPDEGISSSDLKSPSQRLRSVLFAYYKQTHDDASQFPSFYRAALEKYIEQIKDKLE